MRQVLGGLFTALSLYSVIPAPKVEWTKENQKYALCFFPLIGVVITALGLLWYELCAHWGAVPALYAAVAALLPVVVSGGIHMDGFIDTADAISSHALREKKLEILKDPHVGAFGVLFCGGQLLLSFGLWQQLYTRPRYLVLVMAGYVLSRCANALSIATFPTARESGLVHLFASNAAKREVILCNALMAGLLLAACVALAQLAGVVLGGVLIGYFLLHRRFCIWEFGGNTGDLAGFLLQNCELLALVIAVVGGLLA